MWRAKLDQIVILLVALTVLTGVFFFSRLVRQPAAPL
jgi:hypothetical protein